MNSSKCPQCGLVQWAEADSCKRCGCSLSQGAGRQQSFTPNYASQPHQPYTNSSAAQSQQKTGLAIASMVLAIIAFPTTFLLIGIALAPIAIILGIVALVRANKNPTNYGGKGFAIAGISVGSVVCLFFVPLIAAIAIPNILAAKRAANGGSALNALKTIALAQDKHSAMDQTGNCSYIVTLAEKNLIDRNLFADKKNGYKFTATASEDNGCEVRATPESKSEGTHSFYFSSADGVIRVTTDGGREATRYDPPISSATASAR